MLELKWAVGCKPRPSILRRTRSFFDASPRTFGFAEMARRIFKKPGKSEMKQSVVVAALALAACSQFPAQHTLPAVSATQVADNSACLEYEPVPVTLTGTITRHLEYGPPGFGDDTRHDQKLRYWYLDVDKPICVNGKDEDSPDMEAETN